MFSQLSMVQGHAAATSATSAWQPSCPNGVNPIVKVSAMVDPAPPAGFDPTTASAADLKKYGFPPHPKGDDSAWKATMKLAKHKSADNTMWSCPGADSHGPGQPVPAPARKAGAVTPDLSLGSSNYVSYSNWAGNRVDIPTDEATWEWIVPNGYPKTPNTCDSMVSPWVGIGEGKTGDPLVQAGSEDHYDCNGYNVHYLWCQVYPEGAVDYVHPFSVGIADKIYMDVWVDGYTANFYMVDEIGGGYNTYHVNYSGDQSSSAEWIIEKGSNGLTAWNGVMSTYLADWQYEGGSLTTAGSWTHDSIHMVINGVDVAHGGAWTDPGTYQAFPMYSSGT